MVCHPIRIIWFKLGLASEEQPSTDHDYKRYMTNGRIR